jgi:hypothetical protein
MVAVVAALDLDDQVAAGDRAHQVDGVHGRLGARVDEPPERAGMTWGDCALRDVWVPRLNLPATSLDLSKQTY